MILFINKITLFFFITAFIAAPEYQLKKYRQLISQADEISTELNTYFYSGTDVTRQAQLDMFQQKALPEVKVYNHVAAQLDELILPAKEKRISVARSKLIKAECNLYQLLFAEFKDQDYAKYRPEINETTNRVNRLKEELERLK